MIRKHMEIMNVQFKKVVSYIFCIIFILYFFSEVNSKPVSFENNGQLNQFHKKRMPRQLLVVS
jgi:hypothetical protein